MENEPLKKGLASVSVKLSGRDVSLTSLAGTQPGGPTLQFSEAGKPGQLELSEEQLIEMLHKAIHAGVLSHGFIEKLRQKIEI